MRYRSILRPLAGLFGLAGLFQVLAAGPASASVISPTPTLPVIDVPFTSPVGAGCFPAAGVCITSGAIMLTTPVSSVFNAMGQDIVTGGVFTGIITTLAHVPIGPVTLTGSIGQEVMGRTFSSETGVWSTEVTALSLSGPVLGHTLSMTLDTASPSTGSTSIAPIPVGNTTEFRIDSFFDVFVELSLDSIPPLETGRGPLRFVLTPEPSGFLVLASALAGLLAIRRRAGKPR